MQRLVRDASFSFWSRREDEMIQGRMQDGWQTPVAAGRLVAVVVVEEENRHYRGDGAPRQTIARPTNPELKPSSAIRT
jgi:hypothetical protein